MLGCCAPTKLPFDAEEIGGSTFVTGEEDMGPKFRGAPNTTPIQANALRNNSYVMINNNPCKVIDCSNSTARSRKGQGHVNVHIVALDIFTNKKCEESYLATHTLAQPVVVMTNMQVLSVNDSLALSLLPRDADIELEGWETKDDLFLPNKDTNGVTPERQATDSKLAKEICEAVEKAEKDVFVTVQAACGKEKVVAMQLKPCGA